MYDVFSRGTDSRINKVEGSGLGLPICREMVQLMGGSLECESVQGKGTIFTVTAVLEKGRPDEELKLPDMRVLVIDRDTASTNALRDIFKRLGTEADIINDAIIPPSILERSSYYRLAFVDLGVPDNSGIGAVKELRKHFGDDFPVVLTDIADMMEYWEEIEAAGVTMTMSKPYFYQTVYRTILRAVDETAAGGSAQNHSENGDIDEMSVLVAEDNELNWEILCELLKLNGVRTERAENGRICVDMLKRARRGQYAAVLMDVRMPVMNGLEATREIRKSGSEWLRTIPIIAMTADAFAEDINQCIEAGMDAHLAKPINLNRLLATLSDIGGRKRSQQ